MLLRTALRGAALAGAVAMVPAANATAAPTLTLDHSCYLQASTGETLPIGGTVAGLTAGQSVNLRVSRKGSVAGTSEAGTADLTGNLTSSISTWFTPLGSGPGAEVEGLVEAVDVASGTPLASAPTSLANLSYSVTKSGSLHRWKVQGLAALTGQNVYYAHYFNHGKYKGRLKLGTATGACGYLNVKKPLTPFRKLGRYDVAIEALKDYDADAPKFTGRVVVTVKYG